MSTALYLIAATFSLLLSASIAATPLSLNCTPPGTPPPGVKPGPSLAQLIDWLAHQAETAHFAISSVSVNRTNSTGLVQCRSDLNRTQCHLCARSAKRAVLMRCPNSESVAAWLDGCYVEASLAGAEPPRFTASSSCSEQRPVHWVRFESALNQLLMRLDGAAIGHVTATVSDGDHTINGYAECIRTLTKPECGSCIDEATDNLNRSCGGRTKGHVIVGKCVAGFEALSASTRSEEGGGKGRRAVLVCWGAVSACLVGFVWSVWFVQRSIVNHAKVGVIETHQAKFNNAT